MRSARQKGAIMNTVTISVWIALLAVQTATDSEGSPVSVPGLPQ